LQDAHHTPGRDPNPGAFPYGYAFRNDTTKTIMPPGAQQGIPHFSGPDLDDARVLRETAVYIPNFRGPQTPTDFMPPSTWPVLDFTD